MDCQESWFEMALFDSSLTVFMAIGMKVNLGLSKKTLNLFCLILFLFSLNGCDGGCVIDLGGGFDLICHAAHVTRH